MKVGFVLCVSLPSVLLVTRERYNQLADGRNNSGRLVLLLPTLELMGRLVWGLRHQIGQAARWASSNTTQ